jgi:DNA-binding MarR family transcriptional regulator
MNSLLAGTARKAGHFPLGGRAMKKKRSLAACNIIVVGFLLLSIGNSSSSATCIQWPEFNPLEQKHHDRNAIDGLAAYNSDNCGESSPIAESHAQGELPQSQNDYLQITYPNGGETVSGNVTIRWTYGFEKVETFASYSVYYSPNNGFYWIQIANFIPEKEFVWDTVLYEAQGSGFLIKVVVQSKTLGTGEDISDGTFRVDNTGGGSNNLPILLFLFFATTTILGGIGLGYILINRRFKRLETVLAIPQSKEVESIKAIRHKVIVGLDNIKDEFLLESGEIPRLERIPNQITMVDCFPSDFQEDLRTEMKGRTVLTLIEIAYQDPCETNPAKLAKSLNIPPSTLSKELKKLIGLQYIETYVSNQVLGDGRFRNFSITPKGFTFLSILNDALKVTIERARENPRAESAYWGI